MGDIGSEQPPGQTSKGGDNKKKPFSHLPIAGHHVPYEEGMPIISIDKHGKIKGPFPVPMEDSEGEREGETVGLAEMPIHTLNTGRPHDGETAVPPEIAGLGDEPETDK